MDEPEPKKIKSAESHESSSDSDNSSSELTDQSKNRMSVNARTVFIQQIGADGKPDAVVYMDSESSKGDDLSQCSQDSVCPFQKRPRTPMKTPPAFVPPLPADEPEASCSKPEPPSEPIPGPSIAGLRDETAPQEQFSDSESDFDETEIDKILDEGLEAQKAEEAPLYEIYRRTICKRYTKDMYSVLPEGWISVNHRCGIPLYLHRASRVCTWSRPYSLGARSARSHEVPETAIPCLHYKNAKAKALGLDQSEAEPSDQPVETKLEDGESPSERIEDTAPPETQGETPETTKLKEEGEIDAESRAGDQEDKSEAREEDESKQLVNPALKKVKIERVVDCQVALGIDELKEYAKKVFDIEEISIRKFRSWAARRGYRRECRQKSRILMPSSSHLVTCEMPNGPRTQRKEFMLNTSGKSAVGLLHEFVQHSMRDQPKYVFTERFCSDAPYCATIIIGDIEYGVGYGSSKRLAKTDAAKKALSILMPSWNAMEGTETDNAKPEGAQKTQEALDFFDDIAIEDPRLLALCNAAGQMQPLHILMQCLQRNFGLSSGNDIKQKITKESEKTQNIRYEMTVGRHTVEVVSKNKREGKQLAAQQLLAKLHPYIKTWGNILRLYGTHTAKSVKVKRKEQLEITELQTKVSSNAPNLYILSKLRQEMLKLREEQELDPSSLPPSHVKMLHI